MLSFKSRKTFSHKLYVRIPESERSFVLNKAASCCIHPSISLQNISLLSHEWFETILCISSSGRNSILHSLRYLLTIHSMYKAHQYFQKPHQHSAAKDAKCNNKIRNFTDLNILHIGRKKNHGKPITPPWTHPSPQDEKRPCLMSLVSGWNWETQIFKPLQVCTDQHWGPFGSCLTNTLPCTAKIKRWKTRTLWWCGINQATMTPSFLVSISCGKNGRGCDECSLHVPCISLQSKRVPNCCTDRITFGECRWSFEPKQSSKDHETRGCGANPGMWWLVPLRKFKPWRSHPSLLSHWLAAD